MERTYESAAALVGRAAGPLAGHLGAFVSSLIDQQYTASVIYIKAQRALALDRWLAKRGAELADLDDVYIERYQHRRRRRHQRILTETRRRERNHITQLLQFLRDHAVDGFVEQGVERSVIALWLGHETIETTQVYLDADLELKQRVLDAVTPLNGKPGRYPPDDKLLAFLKACNNMDYVPAASPLALDHKPDQSATGHSPARDIIQSLACRQ